MCICHFISTALVLSIIFVTNLREFFVGIEAAIDRQLGLRVFYGLEINEIRYSSSNIGF